MSSLPAIGSLAVPNWNGVGWSQPNGIGTQVFPSEQIATPFTAYPTGGQLWAENSGLWVLGCGHWQNAVLILRAYDSVTHMSAALVCCGLCTFVQRIIEPYEAINDPFQFPVIIP